LQNLADYGGYDAP